jgi:argininosuccinate lyase
VFTAMIASATWNVARMRQSCTGGYANATDVAEYLVARGMPFRTAHAVSAKIVRQCIDKNCNIEDLPFSDFAAASPLFQDDIYLKITPDACVQARDIPGGPASSRVQAQIEELIRFCRAADSP